MKQKQLSFVSLSCRMVYWLNTKELLAQSKYDFWNLSDCNGIPTCNYIVGKETL